MDLLFESASVDGHFLNIEIFWLEKSFFFFSSRRDFEKAFEEFHKVEWESIAPQVEEKWTDF